MRKLLVLAFIVLCGSVIAQDTTSVTIDYVSGDGIWAFLKLNAWPLGLFAFALIEAYIGGNAKLKSNSTIALVVDLIKKLFVKK